MSPMITEFYTAAQADTSLQTQLQKAASAAEVVDIAKARGFSFTAAELKAHSATLTESTLSEAELASVSGGFTYFNHNQTLAGVHD